MTATAVRKFQIRDASFGLALYEGYDAKAALVSFLTDKFRAELDHSVQEHEDGSASASYCGEQYQAIPTVK